MAVGDLIWASSFETSPAMDMGGTVATTGGTVTSSTTQQKTGGSALRINKTANGVINVGINSSNGLSPTNVATRMYGSVWVRLAALPTAASMDVLSFNSLAGTAFWWLNIDTSGNLTCNVGDVNIGVPGASSTVATLTTGTWYLVEYRISVSASTIAMSARVNGGTPQATSATCTTANDRPFVAWFGYNNFNGFSVSNTSRVDMYLDDWTLFEGSAIGEWSGDMRVRTIFPDVSQSDLDTAWTIVGGGTNRADATDECATPGTAPDSTTYIQTVVAATAQRLPMTNITDVDGTIYGVFVATWVGSTTTSGTLTMTITVQNAAGTDHATTYTANANINGFKSPGVGMAFPGRVGGGAWLNADINGIRFKATSTTTTAARRVSAVAMYVPVAASLDTLVNEIAKDIPDSFNKLSETGSGPFADSSGNSHTLTPDTTISSVASIIPSVSDPAASFDYSSGLSQATSSYDDTSTPLTIIYWVKPASLTAGGAQLYNQIIQCATGGGTRGWGTGYRTNGVWSLTFAGVATYEFTTAPVPATVGTVNMVAVVVHGTTADLYINGVLVQSGKATGTMLTGSGPGLILSGYSTFPLNYKVKATVQFPAVYKHEVSAARIAAQYAAGITSTGTSDAATSTSVIVTSGAEAIADGGTCTFAVATSGAEAVADAGTATGVLVTSGAETLADAVTSSVVLVTSGTEAIADAGTTTVIFSSPVADAGTTSLTIVTSGADAIGDTPPRMLAVGGAGNGVSTPNQGSFATGTSNVDLRTAFSLADYRSGTQPLVSQWDGVSGNERWIFQVVSGGFLQVQWRDSGGVLQTATSTAALPATVVADSLIAVRALVEISLGQVTFTYNLSGRLGGTPTQLGSVVTGLSASLQVPGTPPVLSIGRDASGTYGATNGFFYQFQFFNTSLVLVDANFTQFPIGAGPWNTIGGNTNEVWSAVGSGASVPGAYPIHLILSGTEALADTATTTAVIVTAGSEKIADAGTTTLVIVSSGAEAIADAVTSIATIVSDSVERYDAGTTTFTINPSEADAIADAATTTGVIVTSGTEKIADAGTTICTIVAGGSEAIADSFTSTAIIVSGGADAIAEPPGTTTVAIITTGADAIADAPGTTTIVIVTSGTSGDVFDAGSSTIVVVTSGSEAIADAVSSTLVIAASGSEAVADARSTTGAIVSGGSEAVADAGTCTFTIASTPGDAIADSGTTTLTIVAGGQESVGDAGTNTFSINPHYPDVVLADSPDTYWRLGESGAGPFVDIANAHNLTPNTTIVQAPSLVPNELDGAAIFDYTTGLAQATSGYDDAGLPITIEFWVKPISLTAGGGQLYNVVVSNASSGGGHGWSAGYRTNGVWTFILSGVAAYEFTTAPTPAAVGVGHLVQIVAHGSVADLYIDGVIAQAGKAIGSMLTGSDLMAISGFAAGVTGYTIRAVVDDVAIYRVQIDAARLLKHFSASQPYGFEAIADGGTTSLTIATSGAEAVADAGTTVIVISTDNFNIADSGTCAFTINPSESDAIADAATSTFQVANTGIEAVADTGLTTATIVAGGADAIADSGTTTLAIATSGSDAIAEPTRTTTFQIATSGSEAIADSGSTSIVVVTGGQESVADAATTPFVIVAGATPEKIADAATQTALIVTSGAEAVGDASTITLDVLASGTEAVADAGTTTIVISTGGNTADVGTTTIVVASSGTEAVADAGSTSSTIATSGSDAIAEPAATTAFTILESGTEAIADAGATTFAIVSGATPTDAGPTLIAILTSGTETIADTGLAVAVISTTGSESIADSGTTTLSIVGSADQSSVNADAGTVTFTISTSALEAVADAGSATINVTTSGADAISDAGSNTLAIDTTGSTDAIGDYGSVEFTIIPGGQTPNEGFGTCVITIITGGYQSGGLPHDVGPRISSIESSPRLSTIDAYPVEGVVSSGAEPDGLTSSDAEPSSLTTA